MIIDCLEFLSDGNVKFEKCMFIRKGGKATHIAVGDVSRDFYDAELICVTNEDENNWIGNYAEGLGFFGVRFAKEDCRDATDEEVSLWLKSRSNITY